MRLPWDGMAGLHVKQGYMLLLGVLARPWLMIMGFALSLVLMPLIGPYIGVGFDIASSAANANFMTGPLTYFVELAIMGGLMLTLVHKTFGMVTHLDDNVLKWIGGTQTNLGEANDEAKTKGGVAAFYGRVDTAATGVAKGIGEKRKKRGRNPGEGNASDDRDHAVSSRIQ